MESAESVDLGGGEQVDDPLGGVEPDSVFDEGEAAELPPGVEQGSLGGDNPSVEEEGDPLDADDPPAEPEPGEFLEDPEEADPLADPLPPEATPEPEAEPVPAEPEPDPAPEPEPEPEPEPPPTETAPPEPPAEPTTEVGGSAKAKKGGTKGTKAKRKARPGKGDDIREYRPFQGVEFDPDDEKHVRELAKHAAAGRLWLSHDPVESRSGQLALRVIYRDLSGGEEQTLRIAAVPEKLWSPKTVAGQKMDQMAIRIS